MSNTVLGSSKRTQKRLANVRADRHVESRESPSIDVGEEIRQLLENESASPVKKNRQSPSKSVDKMHLNENTTVEINKNEDDKKLKKN